MHMCASDMYDKLTARYKQEKMWEGNNINKAGLAFPSSQSLASGTGRLPESVP